MFYNNIFIESGACKQSLLSKDAPESLGPVLPHQLLNRTVWDSCWSAINIQYATDLPFSLTVGWDFISWLGASSIIGYWLSRSTLFTCCEAQKPPFRRILTSDTEIFIMFNNIHRYSSLDRCFRFCGAILSAVTFALFSHRKKIDVWRRSMFACYGVRPIPIMVMSIDSGCLVDSVYALKYGGNRSSSHYFCVDRLTPFRILFHSQRHLPKELPIFWGHISCLNKNGAESNRGGDEKRKLKRTQTSLTVTLIGWGRPNVNMPSQCIHLLLSSLK